MLMVVRREAQGLVRYCHLGTGNYHTRTARAYTDISLLTCDPVVGEDVHRMFLQMTGLGRVMELSRLKQAPFSLQESLIEKIDREAEEAMAGRPARIVAKMNSLAEPRIIQALYRASRVGVPIDLVVRGICCLRPGVPGVSETIRVRSIIGRFLEHERVYCFHAGGKEEVWCSSADWMQRNFFARVEACFPIEHKALAARVREEALELYLDDEQQAWRLASDGSYERIQGEGRSAQQVLLARHCG